MRILLICFLCSAAFAQNQKQLLGKWLNVAYHGNDGARDYVHEIKDGQIIDLKENGVAVSAGLTGNFSVKDKYLIIRFAKKTEYYYFTIDKNILMLTPVTESLQFICDEGCAFEYRRI